MMNILSNAGMSMQAEMCLWTLVGLVRTIFDATLFKVNANLKQVWQMNMPQELSTSVQRALRMMISGVMLVQCFTVYIYLATYTVLLYPVFLEERPILVLPWLLLSAVRNLLCELTCLALGLGICVFLGPARTPCIKFVIVKFISITPAFYMWMLVHSYYHLLKVAATFNIPAVLPENSFDYGLELAVRRRCTKSLLGEDILRKKMVASFYGERSASISKHTKFEITSNPITLGADTNIEEDQNETKVPHPVLDASALSMKYSDLRTYEEFCENGVIIPRDADRILEQIVIMLLRIAVYISCEGKEAIDCQILMSTTSIPRLNHDYAAMTNDDTETPPLVGSTLDRVRKASYLYRYPHIFQKSKNQSSDFSELKLSSVYGLEIQCNHKEELLRGRSQIEKKESTMIKSRKHEYTEVKKTNSVLKKATINLNEVSNKKNGAPENKNKVSTSCEQTENLELTIKGIVEDIFERVCHDLENRADKSLIENHIKDIQIPTTSKIADELYSKLNKADDIEAKQSNLDHQKVDQASFNTKKESVQFNSINSIICSHSSEINDLKIDDGSIDSLHNTASKLISIHELKSNHELGDSTEKENCTRVTQNTEQVVSVIKPEVSFIELQNSQNTEALTSQLNEDIGSQHALESKQNSREIAVKNKR